MNVQELKKRIIKGERRAIARAITLIEEKDENIFDLLNEIREFYGKAKIIGITGPPGVGKSSLISKLIKEARKENKKVGVLLVDPSSPISGGALLGNRVRMMESSIDENVYIRSFATRGWLGGLSKALSETILILEASGFEIIFIETIGAGQIETEISKKADIVVVVLMPFSGDEIQALKAGLIEIGDIFVINKSDIDKSRAMEAILKTIFGKEKIGKILYTSALYNEGIKELYNTIIKCWNEFYEKGEIEKRRKERIKNEIVESLNEIISSFLTKYLENNKKIEKVVNEIYEKKKSIYKIKKEIRENFYEFIKSKL